jgi:hypothetical protein
VELEQSLELVEQEQRQDLARFLALLEQPQQQHLEELEQ